MRRRPFLHSVAGLSVASALAGCVSALETTSTSSAIGDRDATPHDDGTEAWPGYGFDPANTWHNPDVTLLAEPPSASRLTRNGSGIEPTPDSVVSVAGNRLYFGTTDGFVVSYATTGEREWTYETVGGTPVRSSPALSREVVFVTTENGTAALTAPTGSRLWTSDAAVRAGSSVLVDDRLYAATDDALVTALEVESGDVAWSVSPEAFEDEHARPIATAFGVADDVVYATGSRDGHGGVAAVADGEGLWWREEFGAVSRPPAIAEDVVVVTTRRRVLALDRDDGDVRWEHTVQSAGTHGVTPAVAHGQVYLSADSRTTCLDLEDGDKLWELETGGHGEPPVAVADGAYIGTREGLFALEPDGDLRWHDEGVRTERPVTAVGDRLYAVISTGPLGSGDVYEME